MISLFIKIQTFIQLITILLTVLQFFLTYPFLFLKSILFRLRPGSGDPSTSPSDSQHNKSKFLSKVWQCAHRIVSAIRLKNARTKYSHTNVIEPLKGIYEVNCSGFVNHVLMTEGFTKALEEIRQYIIETSDYGSYRDGRPRALQFVKFMQSKKPKENWISVQKVQDIQPGDIIAYAMETHKITKSGQHVMIVSDKIGLTWEPRWINVPVFDSTGGHGYHDDRGKDGGVGEGIISLEMDDGGRPNRIKWAPGENVIPFKPTISIARVKQIDI